MVLNVYIASCAEFVFYSVFVIMSRHYQKTFGRKVGNVCTTSIQFDKLFKENSNRPSAAKSAGTVGKWGITSFTSIRSSNAAGPNPGSGKAGGGKAGAGKYSVGKAGIGKAGGGGKAGIGKFSIILSFLFLSFFLPLNFSVLYFCR